MYREIKLAWEPEFIRIEGKTRVYYGGDQAWFDFTVGQQGGCGTVAAVNLACYEVLEKPVLTKQEYVKLMNRMYSYVKPYKIPFMKKDKKAWRGFGWTFGVWPASRLVRGFRRYAATEGVKLRPVMIHSRKGRTAVYEYLCRGLEKNHPIAMLLSSRPALKRTPVTWPDGDGWIQATMNYHWVVITGMEEKDDRVSLKVSTWGGYACLDLDLCLKHTKWPEAMVYFIKVK